MKGILTLFCKQCKFMADSWAEINIITTLKRKQSVWGI